MTFSYTKTFPRLIATAATAAGLAGYDTLTPAHLGCPSPGGSRDCSQYVGVQRASGSYFSTQQTTENFFAISV